MTTLQQVVGAPLAEDLNWKSIDWETVEFHVQKLQLRIAKAAGSGRLRKAKALQWLLKHSFYAKLLAVKRITQNKGKNTPGIDRVIWKTSRQKWGNLHFISWEPWDSLKESLLKKESMRGSPMQKLKERNSVDLGA